MELRKVAHKRNILDHRNGDALLEERMSFALISPASDGLQTLEREEISHVSFRGLRYKSLAEAMVDSKQLQCCHRRLFSSTNCILKLQGFIYSCLWQREFSRLHNGYFSDEENSKSFRMRCKVSTTSRVAINGTLQNPGECFSFSWEFSDLGSVVRKWSLSQFIMG